MHSSDDDIITTEVEIITYVEESDGIYKNVKVEDASPVESSFHSVSDVRFVEKFRSIIVIVYRISLIVRWNNSMIRILL